MTDVVILGAGVSGLTAAIELEKHGINCTIIDKENEVGGRLSSEFYNGLPLDKGFQVVLSAYPNVKHYLKNVEKESLVFKPGASIFKDGRRYKIGDPFRDTSLLWPTISSPLVTMNDKLLTLKLKRYLSQISAEACFELEEQSTLDFLLDYVFSERYIDNFFKPFYAGIFLESRIQTSCRMFAFVFKMFSEGNALLPKRGIQEVALELKSQLRSTVFRLNEEVKEVNDSSLVLMSGERIPFGKLIVTFPINKSEDEDPVHWNSCINLYFTYHGDLEDNLINLLTGNSLVNNFHVLPGKTDDHQRILSATVIDAGELEDQELSDAVKDELLTQCGISVLQCVKVFRIEKALPRITDMRYAPETSRPENGNVFYAGDYLANPSLNAAMESGRLAAQRIVEVRLTE